MATLETQGLLDVFRTALDGMRDAVKIVNDNNEVIFQNRAYFDAQKDRCRPTMPELFSTVPLPHGCRMEVEKVQKSEILKRAFDAMPDIVWMARPDGYVEFFSDSCSRFTGMTSEDICGQGWHAVIHPDDLKRTNDIWLNSLRTLSPYSIEYRLRAADGSYEWFIGRARPLYDTHGHVTKWFGSCANVHKLKRTQEELHKAKSELSAERYMFQSMLDHLPVSIIFARAPTGELFYCNEKYEEMWGLKLNPDLRVEHYGANVTAFRMDKTPFKPADWPLARSIMNGEVVRGEDAELHYKDGRIAIIRLSSAPVYDDEGKRIAALAFCEDVTERVKMEDLRTQLMAREQAALEASRIKTEFLRNMSHELRTPAHGVLGVAGMLLDDPDLTEDQRKLVDTIKESGKLLLMVINDILDFSKVEAGKLALEQTTVDLRFIFEHLDLVSQTIAKKRGIKFITKIAPNLPHSLIGDPGRIQQILYNLTNNALKFTNYGHVLVNVTGQPIAHDRFLVQISVSDTGIGISEEILPTLFQPFTQADTSTTRRYGGTGLGLSICKSLVDLMGGRISADSKVGQGTTFKVDLVLPIGTAPLAEASPNHQQPSDAPKILKRIRILVVEDNLVNQKITVQSLKKMGVTHIDLAVNGQIAVNMFQQHNIATTSSTMNSSTQSETTAPNSTGTFTAYDIVLMDVQMPVMDGYKATQHIRNLEQRHGLSRTPIIALTAGALKVDQDACFEADMDDHIAKPFGHEDLCGRILAQLSKWRDDEAGH